MSPRAGLSESLSISPSPGTSGCEGKRLWACWLEQRCLGWPLDPPHPLPLSPVVGEPRSSVRPSRLPEGATGTVAEFWWPFRRNTVLVGASWAGRMRPSYRTDSRPSSPSSTSTAAPPKKVRTSWRCGVEDLFSDPFAWVMSYATLGTCPGLLVPESIQVHRPRIPQGFIAIAQPT